MNCTSHSPLSTARRFVFCLGALHLLGGTGLTSNLPGPTVRTVILVYEPSQRLDSEQIQEADGITTASDYDSVGNRTLLSKTTGNAAPVVSEYNYNALNQLTGFSKTGAASVR